MAGWVRAEHREPIMARGGGALDSHFQALGSRASADVRALVLETVRQVVDRTVAEAAPGTRTAWPIGPPRPWEPGHVHSYTRFRVVDRSRGFWINVQVENPADYAQFIHEPGRKYRLVWEREIKEPLEEAMEDLRDRIADLISAAFNS